MKILNIKFTNLVPIFLQRFSKFWVTFLVKHNKPKLLAKIFALSLYEFSKADLKKNKKIYNVIFLNKSIFYDDIKQGLVPQNLFNLYYVERNFFKLIVDFFLPYSVVDNSYKSKNKEMKLAKKKISNFLKMFIDSLNKYFELDGVLTGNIVYWAEQELAECLDKKNIAFIACLKESIQAPALYEEIIKVRTFGSEPFRGTAVLTYNEKTAKQLIKGKMVDKSKIHVVGMPRLDSYHKLRMKKQTKKNKKKILCLLISLVSQLPCLVYPFTDKRRWRNIADVTHRSLFEYACKHPNVELVIKFKPSDKWQVDLIFEKFGNIIPPNTKITMSESLFNLMKDADVVVGHNSSAIFEAIACGKKCIVPHYEEALKKEFKGRLIDFKNAVTRANNTEELKSLLSRFLNEDSNNVLSSSKLVLLKEWVGNNDGLSGKRMAENTYKIINQKKIELINAEKLH